jgi:hypothetical protein
MFNPNIEITLYSSNTKHNYKTVQSTCSLGIAIPIRYLSGSGKILSGLRKSVLNLF